MNPGSTFIIFGPPGTGKTTTLLDIVDYCIKNTCEPHEICFISFTRKAAMEAKTRAMTKFSLSDDQLPWFRTLHSLAFQQLGLIKQSVMGIRDYAAICEALGLTLTYKGISDDGTFSGLSKGDRLLFMENMSRATLTPLKTYWEGVPDEDIYWYELSRLHETLAQYKKDTGKCDFTDMINRFVGGTGDVPPIKVLIVDEAQDLSPLQWKMVDRLGANVEEAHVAGDDDQAIFRWAGADIEHLIELKGTKRVLKQSYRCPYKVWEVADNIVSRIKTRVPKSYLPTKEVGQVVEMDDLGNIDMSQGTWLLLARNSHFLEMYNQHCISQGYLFDSPVECICSGPVVAAVKIWESLRKGKKMPVIAIRKVYDLMSSKVGVQYGYKTALEKVPENNVLDIEDLRKGYGLMTTAEWETALDKILPVERQYLKLALQNGEKLTQDPRIKISTIHGVKGGEADNVVILPDMATRTQQELEKAPDDEHRVWYVAVTRAKHNLYILMPTTTRYYDLLS